MLLRTLSVAQGAEKASAIPNPLVRVPPRRAGTDRAPASRPRESASALGVPRGSGRPDRAESGPARPGPARDQAPGDHGAGISVARPLGHRGAVSRVPVASP